MIYISPGHRFFCLSFLRLENLNSISTLLIWDSWIHNSTTAGKFRVNLNFTRRRGHLETIMQLGNWNSSRCLVLNLHLFFSLRKQFPCFFSASVSISRSQTSEWSQEELQLATGGQATTHVKHELKLHSAYTEVPVSGFISSSLLHVV